MTTTTTETRKVPAQSCWIGDGVQFQLLQAAGDGEAPKLKREWSMVANTGQVMNRWWGKLVLDLGGAKFNQRLGLLLDHDVTQRLGYSTKVEVTPQGLVASGKLLKNELADQILAESGDGFPFQASLMAVPKRVQELDEGQEAEVNGKTMQGPLTIFREWTARELTLTVLGADADTMTQAFAEDGDLEVTVTKKTNVPAAPANEEVALSNQPQSPAPTPTPTVEVLDSAAVAKAERERCDEILKHCAPEQMELGQKLIRDGVPLQDALSQIIRDVRLRVSPPRSASTEPQGLGNAGQRTQSHEEKLAQLHMLPDSAEKYEQLFAADESLQREFHKKKDLYLAYALNKNRCQDFNLALNERGELLSGALQGLSFRNVKGTFFLAMQERERAMWTKAVTTDVPSDQPFEIHKGLNGVPAMAKWAGERRRQALKELSLTVLNDKYESTITVDIDDLRRDKTGMIQRRIGEMGAKAATLPQRIFTTLLEANGNGYDGAAFFADTHLHGGTIDNNLAGSASTPATPTSAEMSAAILAAIQAQLAFQDDRGDPVNEDANSFAIVVPAKYWGAAIAAKTNDFTSAGVSNTVKTSGMSIEVFVNPRLTAANNIFFCFRTNVPQGALLWQEETIPDGFKTLGPDSSEGFWKEQLAFGAKRIGAGALARFEFASRTTLS